MRYHHFSTHTCVLPRCDETENILKKMFSFKHCPKRGWGFTATTGGSLLFQADVLSSMANGAMVYKKWQSRYWRRSSNLPPYTFLETFILEKWKLTKIRFGSTMEVINREVIIFVAPGQQVAAGFASISRSRVVNFWNVHHCHCWKE